MLGGTVNEGVYTHLPRAGFTQDNPPSRFDHGWVGWATNKKGEL